MVRAYRRKISRADIERDIFKIIDMPADALAHKLDINYESAKELQDELARLKVIQEAQLREC